MTKLITILLLIFLAGCAESQDELQIQETDNDKYEVKHLFTVDGCKMYKFTDFRKVYFMTCPNSSTQYNADCGKGCTTKIQQVTK